MKIVLPFSRTYLSRSKVIGWLERHLKEQEKFLSVFSTLFLSVLLGLLLKDAFIELMLSDRLHWSLWRLSNLNPLLFERLCLENSVCHEEPFSPMLSIISIIYQHSTQLKQTNRHTHTQTHTHNLHTHTCRHYKHTISSICHFYVSKMLRNY